MKQNTIFKFTLLIFILFTQMARAEKIYTNESATIHDVHGVYIDILKNIPNSTLDHFDGSHYEFHGPVGSLMQLDLLGIPFDVSKLNKQSMADYPSYLQIKTSLENLADKYSEIMTLTSIGKSVEGRDLLVMKISDNPLQDEIEPEVKYISSMHGNEITGRELMVRLIEEIGANYNSNPSITRLVNNTEIYIMASMNPDGSERRNRGNANYVDLNRDFPDFSTSDNENTIENREPETQAIMQYQAGRHFSLSANFHGGAEVVNYPWDTTATDPPMIDFIQEISLKYAQAVPYIANSQSFYNGITNGYAWYEVNGGMQDWSFHWHNDLQLTVELSDYKWPNYDRIPYYFTENKTALIEFLQNVHHGAGFTFRSNRSITGTVSIEDTDGKNFGEFDFKNSEFFKVLPMGSYIFKISYQGKEKILNKDVLGFSVVNNGNYSILED